MNNKNPALNVSVILPVYFRESSLENLSLLTRAIDSIHTQNFPSDYEILIIDDGSATPLSDFSYLLGNERLKKLRFIRLQRNYGLVYALNKGVLSAQYPWIARLDADDYWLDGKIEKQFALITADDDISIVATGMTRLKSSGAEIDVHIRPRDWHGILRFFIDVGCPFPHGSVLGRCDIYRLLGGYTHDPAFSHCEDFALWGTWLRFFKPIMVEEALYNYTVSGNSVSGIYGEQQELASKKVRQNFSDLNLSESLPDTLSDLSSLLGCSLLDAGKLAYKIWRYSPVVRLPAASYDLIEAIMPDRRLLSAQQGWPILSINQLIGHKVDTSGRFVEIRAV